MLETQSFPDFAKDPVVDLSFPICGDPIPADHGYHLFAGISKLVPEIHGELRVGIHPIRGTHIPPRALRLERRSRLTLRTPASLIGPLLRLAGNRVSIGGAGIRPGAPSVRSLQPCPNLYSRLVVVKHCIEADDFLDRIRRDLRAMGVEAQAEIPRRRGAKPWDGGIGSRDGYLRRTITIAGRRVVGYAVLLRKLTASDSLKVQALGLGGRRRFGCGIFVPYRKGCAEP
jgi:CRISPR-associated protein Cas6